MIDGVSYRTLCSMARPRWVGWSPLVSVSIMAPTHPQGRGARTDYYTLATRRAAGVRRRKRVLKAKLEITMPKEEGTVEDSDGPGSNLGRAHGSSGVHKNPDNESSAKKPSEADCTRGGRSADRSMASRHDSDDESRLSGRRISFAARGSAPDKHANPSGNATPTNKPLGNETRGSPHTGYRR